MTQTPFVNTSKELIHDANVTLTGRQMQRSLHRMSVVHCCTRCQRHAHLPGPESAVNRDVIVQVCGYCLLAPVLGCTEKMELQRPREAPTAQDHERSPLPQCVPFANLLKRRMVSGVILCICCGFLQHSPYFRLSNMAA